MRLYYLLTCFLLVDVTAFAVPIKLRVNRAVEDHWEFLAGHGDTADLLSNDRIIPVSGRTAAKLNRLIEGQNPIVKVPLSDDVYALGAWSGMKPRLELEWDHEEIARVRGTISVEYWRLEEEEGVLTERKVTRDISLADLQFADLEGYFPVPFESAGLVLLNSYDEAFPMSLVGIYHHKYLGAVPSAHVHLVGQGLMKRETISSYFIPLRLSRWTDKARSIVFPSRFDSHLAQYHFGDLEIGDGFQPSPFQTAREEIKRSLIGGGNFPQHETFLLQVLRDIRTPGTQAQPTRWQAFVDSCFGWLIRRFKGE